MSDEDEEQAAGLKKCLSRTTMQIKPAAKTHVVDGDDADDADADDDGDDADADGDAADDGDDADANDDDRVSTNMTSNSLW